MCSLGGLLHRHIGRAIIRSLSCRDMCVLPTGNCSGLRIGNSILWRSTQVISLHELFDSAAITRTSEVWQSAITNKMFVCRRTQNLNPANWTRHPSLMDRFFPFFCLSLLQYISRRDTVPADSLISCPCSNIRRRSSRTKVTTDKGKSVASATERGYTDMRQRQSRPWESCLTSLCEAVVLVMFVATGASPY
jgi:hypothetical protein